MARYTGPKARVSRRLGDQHLGERQGENRALERRPYPPGEHGRSRRRNPSEYLAAAAGEAEGHASPTA